MPTEAEKQALRELCLRGKEGFYTTPELELHTFDEVMAALTELLEAVKEEAATVAVTNWFTSRKVLGEAIRNHDFSKAIQGGK